MYKERIEKEKIRTSYASAREGMLYIDYAMRDARGCAAFENFFVQAQFHVPDYRARATFPLIICC